MSSKGSFKREIFKYIERISNFMNKKGEVVVLVFAILMIIATSTGIFLTLENSKTLYVGDTSTKTYVEYFKCESIAKNISESNFIIFKSQQEAINSGYNATFNCV